MSNKATTEEMKVEAIKRLELLHVPEEIIAKYPKAFEQIPVTYFCAEVGEMKEVHKEVLKLFFEKEPDGLPFYITESWHGWDVISVLYIGANKEDWEMDREVVKAGYHTIFSYNRQEKYGELGDGLFSIEDGVLWRVY